MTLMQERGAQGEHRRAGEIRRQPPEFRGTEMVTMCGTEDQRKGSCIMNDLQKSSEASRVFDLMLIYVCSGWESMRLGKESHGEKNKLWGGKPAKMTRTYTEL